MSKTRLFRAFSMSEVLIALSLVGILALTMLSLNNMSTNKFQIAQTKILQTDSALKSWAKAEVKSNEMGLGITQSITSEDSLKNSLMEYLNNQGSDIGGAQKLKGEDLDSSNKITLDNGVELQVSYLKDKI